MQYTLSFSSVQVKKHLDLKKHASNVKKQAKKHPKRVQEASKKGKKCPKRRSHIHGIYYFNESIVAKDKPLESRFMSWRCGAAKDWRFFNQVKLVGYEYSSAEIFFIVD